MGGNTNHACPDCGVSIGQQHREHCDADKYTPDQQNNEPERSAADVYWEYVEKIGEDACDHAVLHYFDQSIVVEILLEHIDADSLDDFLAESQMPIEIRRRETGDGTVGSWIEISDLLEAGSKPPHEETCDWSRQGF